VSRSFSGPIPVLSQSKFIEEPNFKIQDPNKLKIKKQKLKMKLSLPMDFSKTPL
jgi:hypothetical protein